MRKYIVKRISIIEIIIVLFNYLKRKLLFCLYRTILYWDFSIEKTIYSKEIYVKQNYNSSLCFFLSYCSR